LDPLPSFVVPAVETVAFASGSDEAKALRLEFLSRIDSEPEAVTASLDVFVKAFADWVTTQEGRVPEFGNASSVAATVVARSRTAANRMQASVDLLRRADQDKLRTAFALGMAAMRLQLRQAKISQGTDPDVVAEPTWRPFQLGFILVS